MKHKHCYAFDGNKNVSDVFYRLTSNGIGAHYDYAPFGATPRTHRDSSASFDIVSLNPFRFSSEFYDSELDLVYYNYRHYSPSLGRFLSRDPIAEQGGLNLYAFVGNACFTNIDYLGKASLAEIIKMLVAIEGTSLRCSKCSNVVEILREIERKIYEENEKDIEKIMVLVRDFSGATETYASGKKKIIDLTLFLEDVFGKENVNKSALKDLSGGLGRATNVLNKIKTISDVGDSLNKKDGLDLFLTITNQFPVAQILTGHLRDAYRGALVAIGNLKYNPNNIMLINEAGRICRVPGGCCAAEAILGGLRK